MERQRKVSRTILRRTRSDCRLAGFKPTKLDSDEQAKIAKVGLEMKLITSEMDNEAEKWDDPQNEVAKVGVTCLSMRIAL